MGKDKKIKVLFTGGGTGGSAAPLLALVDHIRSKAELNKIFEFLWIGTQKGVEKEMAENENLEYKSIKCGKLRRYFSWRNLVDPFFVIYGFFQSLFIIKKWKPNIVISAGSYVSVGVAWAAWLFKVPVIIHQQDARAGFANKLMSPFAKVITVTFEASLKDYGKKAIWTGNPARNKLKEFKIDKRSAMQKLGLNPKFPLVLVLGGGTGAQAINSLVLESIEELVKFTQVLHLTGKGKAIEFEKEIRNYRQFNFLHVEGMAKVFAAADVVVSRAGMGVLTELSFLSKPAIIIPIPDSHQEENAQIMKGSEAALVLKQNKLNKSMFIGNIKKLLNDLPARDKYAGNISKIFKKQAAGKIIEIICKTAI